MSDVPKYYSDVINIPTNTTQCAILRPIEVEEVSPVPPAVSIAFSVLLLLVLLLDRRLLNKLDKERRRNITAVVFLVTFLALPSLLDALFSLVQLAFAFEEKYDIIDRIFECLDGVTPKSMNGVIPALLVLVSRLAASIGEFAVIVFGVFEDYKLPELSVKKRRFFAGLCAVILSTLIGGFFLIRGQFSGFGCGYEKQVNRYFCYTEDTAKEISKFLGVTSQNLKTCDRANSFVEGSVSHSSGPPRCLAGTFPAAVQTHFQTIVQTGLSSTFSIASIATATVLLLSTLTNFSFIVYRLWKKRDVSVMVVLLASFIVGLSNSMTVFLFVLRHLNRTDRVRVVACGCAIDEAEMDWAALARKMSGLIMSLNVAMTYSKVEIRPNDVKYQGGV